MRRQLGNRIALAPLLVINAIEFDHLLMLRRRTICLLTRCGLAVWCGVDDPGRVSGFGKRQVISALGCPNGGKMLRHW
jgi:hypothetical protein